MSSPQISTLVSFIWGIADDCLRDVYVRGKYRDVILPMTVVRRLDAVLEPTKKAVLALKAELDAAGVSNQAPGLCKAAGQAFCNDSPFVLRDLVSRPTPQRLLADFKAYLDGFSPNVQEILQKFKFREQLATMHEAGILGAVVEKFVSPSVNLSPRPVLADDGSVRLPGLDNHAMGTVFEELIRRFNEENNEEAGEHFTPRDVVELMADLVFVPVRDRILSSTYTCYDGASGTGGMLTVAEARLQALARAAGKSVSIHLFGQEVNPETYAITKADMLLKGDGAEASNIAFGSTLSSDGFPGAGFDFMLSNPPYGKSWKVDAEKLGGKKGIQDPRFVVRHAGDGLSMVPRTSDGQLLFLLNNVAKMKRSTPLGSRIAEVHNGSSLFTGGAGQGESNARRYLFENDLVEAVVALPENMFYNTGIGTFVWILSNKKAPERRGKVQLIDATALKVPLRKNLGQKNCALSAENRAEILRLFLAMEDGPCSRVFPNEEFGYREIAVERPLRLRVEPGRPLPAGLLKPAEAEAWDRARAALGKKAPLSDWAAFARATRLKPALLKKLRPHIAVRDEAAAAVPGEADPELRDTETVPLLYPGGVEAFLEKEVLPFAPDAWIDPAATRIGYEVSFTKYFYKPAPLRPLDAIAADLRALETETAGLLDRILEDRRP